MRQGLTTMSAKPKHGTAIFRSIDDGVELQVRDEGNVRYLYLENDAIQSAIILDDPAALPIAYTRYMAGALLLNPRPRRVLLIGLGGGALVRFVQHCAPQCEIDAVEARADVLHVAQEFFSVRPSTTLRLWHQDGADFVRQQMVTDTHYDIIFMDAFNHRGLAAPARDARVYAACGALTRTRGMLVSNLWASAPKEFRYCRGLAERYFPGRITAIPVPQRGNVVVLAQHDHAVVSHTQLESRAAAIKEATGVSLNDVARSYHAHQNSLWQRLGFDKIGRVSRS